MKTTKLKTKYTYIIVPIAILVMLAAFSAPVLATWGAVPLSDDARSVEWENLTVENGSLYIGYEGGINPENYTYHFAVPAGTPVRSHLCTDVWSANSCGEIYFEFNGYGTGCDSSPGSPQQSGDSKPFGWYRFGKDGGGCGYGTCDTNVNVAGNGCGGNGVWWNVTNNVTAGAINDFVANARPWPQSCIFDGRKRGANLVHVYKDTATSTETLYIWFNQGMEDDTPITVDINNVNNASASIWTLYVCVDCCDSGDSVTFNGHQFSWTEYNHWMSINSYNVTDYVKNGHNTVISTGDSYHHPFWTLLVGSGSPLPPPKPDLNVTAIDTHVERDGQTPIDFVANHDYTIEATIKETAGVDITQSFNVSFYDGATEREKKTIDSLDASDEVVVSFNWTSNVTVGSHTLKIVADTDDNVEEVLEDNNASNVVVNVLSAGTVPDLDIASSDHMAFLPTYKWHAANDTTTIELNISNTNTGDSGTYYADLYVGEILKKTQSMPSVNAKSWMKNKTFVYDAPPGTTYTIEVGLRDVPNETNPNNNNATKNLRTIGNVTVKNTHEFGNTSSYTGYLSGCATVVMFNVTRVVPENTTLYNLLSSVAVVDTGNYRYKAYGIDGLEQDVPNSTYWYAFVNGIPVNDSTETNDLYQLKEGDVAHWDILKYVNSGQELEGEGIYFKPRPVMDYPEPFLHGYGGTVWNTTIVYPSNPASGYLAKATAIKSNLNQSGVPNENINITTDTALTNTEKTNNHLILIGTPSGLMSSNSIIADINDNHTEIGTPAYFNDNGRLIDDWLDDHAGGCDHKAQYHGVVMACDNPYNNAAPWEDTWKDSDQTIWIASGVTDSGVTDCYAKYAADMLASGNLDDTGFWNVTRKGVGIANSCGDVNGDCAVSISDAYAVVSYTIFTSEWAADVTCVDCTISITDAYKIVSYSLNCCSD